MGGEEVMEAGPGVGGPGTTAFTTSRVPEPYAFVERSTDLPAISVDASQSSRTARTMTVAAGNAEGICVPPTCS